MVDDATLAAPDGASLVGFKQPWLSAREYDILCKGRQSYDLSDFGCPGIGADWTTPMQSASLVMAFNGARHVHLPEGALNFETQITFNGSDKCVAGKGRGATTLVYQGSNDTNDLIVVGDVVNPYQTERFDLRDFKIESATTMYDGSALKLHRWAFSTLQNVTVGHQDQAPKVHDGLHFSGFSDCHVFGFNVRGNGKGVKVQGLTSASDPINGGWGSGLSFTAGKVALCGEFGVHIGGGAGGVMFNATDVIKNASTGMLIDNQLVALQNREVFAGTGNSFDSNGVYGIHVNDTLTGNGWLGFDGVWSAANHSHNVFIDNWGTYGRVSLMGATMQLSQTGDGLRVADNTCAVNASKASIFNNAGYGINDVGNGYNIDYSNIINCANNGLGFYRAGANTISVPIKRERKFSGTLNGSRTASVAHKFDNAPTNLIAINAHYVHTAGHAVAITNIAVDGTNIILTADAGGANRPFKAFAVFEVQPGG